MPVHCPVSECLPLTHTYLPTKERISPSRSPTFPLCFLHTTLPTRYIPKNLRTVKTTCSQPFHSYLRYTHINKTITHTQHTMDNSKSANNQQRSPSGRRVRSAIHLSIYYLSTHPLSTRSTQCLLLYTHRLLSFRPQSQPMYVDDNTNHQVDVRPSLRRPHEPEARQRPPEHGPPAKPARPEAPGGLLGPNVAQVSLHT